MSQDDVDETGPGVADAPKKAWVDPQLDVFPMSEAENGHPSVVNDGVTNGS
jgi:hypothetical protein